MDQFPFNIFQDLIPGVTLDLKTGITGVVVLGIIVMGFDYLREVFCFTDLDMKKKVRQAEKDHDSYCDERKHDKELRKIIEKIE